MTSSKLEPSEMHGPPKELFELALALDEADLSIEKCLSIMQNTQADFQNQQQDAFLKIYLAISKLQAFIGKNYAALNTRPLFRLLTEWHDTFNGSQAKSTNIAKPGLKKGGKPILADKNHVRAILVAAVKIQMNNGLKAGKAEEKVFRDTGVKQTTLRNWRSYMNRKKGPPATVKALALSFEDDTDSPNQYEALIQLYRENKIV